MGSEPQLESDDAPFPEVLGDTVPRAQEALTKFKRIIWQDIRGVKIANPEPNWLITAQAPSSDGGKSMPTSSAITLTIAAPLRLY